MRDRIFNTVLAVVTLIITSCSKNKSPDTSSNIVTATISIASNASFQFSATGTAVKIYTAASGPSNYRIEAIDPNNNKIFIAVDNVTQTGTYAIMSNDGIFGNALTFIKGLGTTSQLAYWTIDQSIIDKGSVKITALNSHHIEGTFTAVCKSDDNIREVAHIDNGSFKINF